MKPILQVEGLEAGYGETTVLRGISLEVPAEGVLAVLGPNGAGKTTLLRAISGLLPARRGRVGLDGNDISRRSASERVRRGLCHVPDPRGIFPSLSVRDNLVLQAPRGEVDASIEKAVATFPRLGERLEQLAGTLSGGEQQMLAVSRAYVQSPKVVLLDEVSMGLAPNIVDEIFVFLDRVAHEGSSLLLVEQYVTRALGLADYVYLMNRGTIAVCAEPSDLADEDVFAR